jgi:Uma2 family endonuclease
VTVRQNFDFYRRYTAEEFLALPVDTTARYELQDGWFVVSRNPGLPHQAVMLRLVAHLDDQLPESHAAIHAVDVDLQLPSHVVRVPDIVVVREEEIHSSGTLTAAKVSLAIEIISPETLRTDTKIKPIDYADAGVPHLWLIDPHRPVTATVLTLVDGKYEESQRVEGSFTVTEPFPLTIDLDKLRRSAERG